MIETYFLTQVNPIEVIPYQEHCFRKAVENARSHAPMEQIILFLEYTHCYSIAKESDLAYVKDKALFDSLTKTGIAPIIKMRRGGSLTYHGPGQMIVWPVLIITTLGLSSMEEYISFLETVCIIVLKKYNIQGVRGDAGKARGVWASRTFQKSDSLRKIVSIGIRTRFLEKSKTYVVSGGFALNIMTDLRYFSAIHPCGLIGKEATSMQKILGYAPSVKDIRDEICKTLAHMLGISVPFPTQKII